MTPIPLECVHCLRKGEALVNLETMDITKPAEALAGRMPRGWSLTTVQSPVGARVKVACPSCSVGAH
jgi:hypothetical protein